MTDSLLKAGERIDQLFSSNIKIIQNKDVFSFSVDSVLLSRFPNIPAKKYKSRMRQTTQIRPQIMKVLLVFFSGLVFLEYMLLLSDLRDFTDTPPI